ncbi:MAG: hypothetical protein PWP24_1204 [Clostridiales bacterium]|nr:hypothetical protein [Clostridiales bacterium]
MQKVRIPTPVIGFDPPVYVCKRANKPFYLDGSLDKEFWKEASFTEEFQSITGDEMEKPAFSTKVKMLWDEEYFYFGAQMEGEEIWATLEEKDSKIFLDNAFEILIDPDSDTHDYFEFEVNAKNTIWDLFLTKPYRDNGRALSSFDIKGTKSAVKIEGELNKPGDGNKRWTVEVAMPFSVLKECAAGGRTPVCGDFWRVNFVRVHWWTKVVNGQYQKEERPEQHWVWAPTGVVNIHYPELWGVVFFADGEETFSLPSYEYEKWELRKIYYKLHEYYDKYGFFPKETSNRVEEIFSSKHIKIESTTHNFELSCISEDGTYEVSMLGDGKTSVKKADKERALHQK